MRGQARSGPARITPVSGDPPGEVHLFFSGLCVTPVLYCSFPPPLGARPGAGGSGPGPGPGPGPGSGPGMTLGPARGPARGRAQGSARGPARPGVRPGAREPDGARGSARGAGRSRPSMAQPGARPGTRPKMAQGLAGTAKRTKCSIVPQGIRTRCSRVKKKEPTPLVHSTSAYPWFFSYLGGSGQARPGPARPGRARPSQAWPSPAGPGVAGPDRGRSGNSFCLRWRYKAQVGRAAVIKRMRQRTTR